VSVIATVSGGKASAYCAWWALREFHKSDVILYFNDTKWEHPDLYRFLDDLQCFLDHEIVFDSDGRTPEQLFYDSHALANDRMPFCSRILKAERLQKFYKDGDTLVFGIGMDEPKRAYRLVQVYQKIAAKKNKWPARVTFPLIEEHITNDCINEFIAWTGIEIPLLYRLGFKHNNCSGGCVRAGKKHWKVLYERLPDVYTERERVEEEFRERTGEDVHFFKDETLKEFRGRIERGELSRYYDTEEEDTESECIGICQSQS